MTQTTHAFRLSAANAIPFDIVGKPYYISLYKLCSFTWTIHQCIVYLSEQASCCQGERARRRIWRVRGASDWLLPHFDAAITRMTHGWVFIFGMLLIESNDVNTHMQGESEIMSFLRNDQSVADKKQFSLQCEHRNRAKILLHIDWSRYMTILYRKAKIVLAISMFVP